MLCSRKGETCQSRKAIIFINHSWLPPSRLPAGNPAPCGHRDGLRSALELEPSHLAPSSGWNALRFPLALFSLSLYFSASAEKKRHERTGKPNQRRVFGEKQETQAPPSYIMHRPVARHTRPFRTPLRSNGSNNRRRCAPASGSLQIRPAASRTVSAVVPRAGPPCAASFPRE